MSRASDELLGMVHGLLAQRFIAQLNAKDETGAPAPLAAAEVANILRMLKDNNITCGVGGDNELDELLRSLNTRKQNVKAADDKDLSNALAQMGHVGGLN